MAAKRRVRILHVHSDLQWGGIEQWLLNLARHIDRDRFSLELFAASLCPTWQKAVADLGLHLTTSPRPRQMLLYLRRLRKLLRSRSYDILHCHFFDHAGLILRTAALEGVPVRIAHSHIDTGPLLTNIRWWQSAYFRLQNRFLLRYATRGLAASHNAARSMFGEQWHSDSRWRVLHCGIDLKPFDVASAASDPRREFGFSPEHLVFGHAGRFTPQKNHFFLAQVAEHIASRLPNARFLWVGDGPYKADLQAYVGTSVLSNRVAFTSHRTDVPALMRGAMDAFLFPSRYEGLGLSLVEAQAAGLRCFVSDAVPVEADVVPELITRLPLAAGPVHWAQEILHALNQPRTIPVSRALEMVQQSSFNIERNTRSLEALYSER